MKVTAANLELRIANINKELMHGNPSLEQQQKITQRRTFYVEKLGEMDENGLKTIDI